MLDQLRADALGSEGRQYPEIGQIELIAPGWRHYAADVAGLKIDGQRSAYSIELENVHQAAAHEPRMGHASVEATGADDLSAGNGHGYVRVSAEAGPRQILVASRN